MTAASSLATSGCGPERGSPTQLGTPGASTSPSATATPSGSTSSATQVPRSGAPRTSGDACAGLAPLDCARTKGCLLDQITYREMVCRAADDACEGSVRHVDLIGSEADPSITADMTRAARERCEATRACKATSGSCACATELFGKGRCECGGHYLPRCTLAMEAPIYEGVPPMEIESAPLVAWAKVIVAVRRASRETGAKPEALPDPGLLAGKKRAEIETSLGTPYPCTGNATPSAPCKSASDVFYSLYRLPRGWLGGGPELLVTYDASGTCTRATITHTR